MSDLSHSTPGFEIPLGTAANAPVLSLTRAVRGATTPVQVIDHEGLARGSMSRASTRLPLYLDRREGGRADDPRPGTQALVMGYLRNQRLVERLDELAAVHVDWETEACAISTRAGNWSPEARMARRTVTTGCGQGTMFGDWLDDLEPVASEATLDVATLDRALGHILALDTIYKRSGSVHGCALLCATRPMQRCSTMSRTSVATTRSTASPASCGWTRSAAPTRSSIPPAGSPRRW